MVFRNITDEMRKADYWFVAFTYRNSLVGSEENHFVVLSEDPERFRGRCIKKMRNLVNESWTLIQNPVKISFKDYEAYMQEAVDELTKKRVHCGAVAANGLERGYIRLNPRDKICRNSSNCIPKAYSVRPSSKGTCVIDN